MATGWQKRNLILYRPKKGNKLLTQPLVKSNCSLLQLHSKQTLPVYIFSLGQTNTTYGFINIHFPALQCLYETCHTLKQNIFSYEDDLKFWEKYEPDFSLREACQLGEIGLRSLRPKDFGKLMEGKFSPIKFSDKKQTNIFKYYNLD